jgi:hypothetical protein
VSPKRHGLSFLRRTTPDFARRGRGLRNGQGEAVVRFGALDHDLKGPKSPRGEAEAD